MDIDSPSGMKRCNSAPIINDINPNATMTTSPPATLLNRESVNFNIFSSQARIRRFSASSSFSPHSYSPNIGLRLTPRVDQLKQEDLCNREVSHEREVHSAMQISQSYEDLTLDTELLSCKANSTDKTSNLGGLLKQCITQNPLMSSKMLPLNVQMPVSGPPLCSSPSPTRPGLGRQCFSPNMSWKTSSPSPTRKAFATRRSLSPIAMRPSSFGPLKRKVDLDDESKDSYMTPAKRPATQIFSQSTFMNTNSLYTPTSNLVLSASSASPISGSLSSSVGTPESMSSSGSPNFTFRPVNSPSSVSSNADEPMMQEDRGNIHDDLPTKTVTMKTDT